MFWWPQGQVWRFTTACRLVVVKEILDCTASRAMAEFAYPPRPVLLFQPFFFAIRRGPLALGLFGFSMFRRPMD